MGGSATSPLVLLQCHAELLLDRVHMSDQICASLLDGLSGHPVIRSLAFELNAVFKRMRLTVASELDRFIAKELQADDISQSVVLVLNVDD